MVFGVWLGRVCHGYTDLRSGSRVRCSIVRDASGSSIRTRGVIAVEPASKKIRANEQRTAGSRDATIRRTPHAMGDR